MSPGSPPPDRPPQRDPTNGFLRWPYAVLAYVSVGLALIGVVLPVVPTFPFLLLAAWAASRGSRRVHEWLYTHPRFGPSLVQWRDEGAITRRSKVTAVSLIILSWFIMLWQIGDWRLLVPMALLFTGVSTYLISRPEPTESAGTDAERR